MGDAAYHAKDKIFRPLPALRIIAVIAERNREYGSGLGQYRYVVEACFDWLFNWRRSRVRYEKRPDIHDGFLSRVCPTASTSTFAWRMIANASWC